MKEIISIDGAQGEGGGQIIRTGVSLAAITGRTVEIVRIRARRSKPGLQAQHLTAVRAAGALCNATLYGAELGSQYLHFIPGKVDPAESAMFRFDVAEARGGASAGATGLVAQTVLVPLTMLHYGAAKVEILGGTHVPMAPPTDYIEAVYAPMLQRTGVRATCRYDRAGFFPRGGGALHLVSEGGTAWTPLDLAERGRLQSLRVFIVTSQLPTHVFERGREALLKPLKGYGIPFHCEHRDLPSNGPGAAVVLVAECENGRGGWTGLGERGKPIERVAEEALRGFQKWFATGAAVDEHLADQLVLPCALIPGESRWTTSVITEHLRTVLNVTRQFLPITFTLEERAEGTGLVTLKGAPYYR